MRAVLLLSLFSVAILASLFAVWSLFRYHNRTDDTRGSVELQETLASLLKVQEDNIHHYYSSLRAKVDEIAHTLATDSASCASLERKLDELLNLQRGEIAVQESLFQLLRELSNNWEQTASSDSNVIISEPPICDYYGERYAKECRIDLGNELVVGVITYYGNHQTKVKLAKETWLSPHLLNTSVYIFSEVQDDSVPTIVTPGCRAEKLSARGLVCKVREMYRWMYYNLPLRKWYYRALDDTMINLPELVRYLRKHDHTKPMIIGMRQIKVFSNNWERHEDYDGPEDDLLHFAQGGSGWAISRAYLEKFMQEYVDNLQTIFDNWGIADDAVFGALSTKIWHIPITMSRGISKYRPEVNKCGFPWTFMTVEQLLTSQEIPICPTNESQRWDNVDNEPITVFHMGFESAPDNWKVMGDVMKLFITNKYTTKMEKSKKHSDQSFYIVCPCR